MTLLSLVSKDCTEYKLWRGKERSHAFQEWWEGYQHKCYANFEGSSESMDT